MREDQTIRPLSDQNKCFYHKVNGFTVNEKVYVGSCVNHDRYRWDFTQNGQIINWNRKWLIPHCITIPDYTNSKKFQQLFLSPCEEGNLNQSWMVEDGMIKIKANPLTCLAWNLGDKTRLWSIGCVGLRFS